MKKIVLVVCAKVSKMEALLTGVVTLILKYWFCCYFVGYLVCRKSEAGSQPIT